MILNNNKTLQTSNFAVANEVRDEAIYERDLAIEEQASCKRFLVLPQQDLKVQLTAKFEFKKLYYFLKLKK